MYMTSWTDENKKIKQEKQINLKSVCKRGRYRIENFDEMLNMIDMEFETNSVCSNEIYKSYCAFEWAWAMSYSKFESYLLNKLLFVWWFQYYYRFLAKCRPFSLTISSVSGFLHLWCIWSASHTNRLFWSCVNFIIREK